jgi:hypothetical protein
MVAKVSAVEKELQEATGVKKKVAEKFQKYAVRLINAVQELKDPEWEALSTETQEWVNDGAKAIKAEEDVDGFPEDEAEAEEENEEAAEAAPATRTRGGGKTTEKETTSRRTSRGDGDEEKKSTRRTSSKDEDKKPKKERAEGKQVGAQTMIKELMCDDPKATTEELLAKLAKKGYTPTPLAVSSIRSGFRHSLKVLDNAGKLKGMSL